MKMVVNTVWLYSGEETTAGPVHNTWCQPTYPAWGRNPLVVIQLKPSFVQGEMVEPD